MAQWFWKFRPCDFVISLLSPLREGYGKLKSPSPNDASCQVCQVWLNGSGEADDNVKSLQTDYIILNLPPLHPPSKKTRFLLRWFLIVCVISRIFLTHKGSEVPNVSKEFMLGTIGHCASVHQFLRSSSRTHDIYSYC